MSGLCDGRVVIVTGAGRGIGRGEALEFAKQGAKVVVNDFGGDVHGESATAESPAERVAAEIRAAGGQAVANNDDVADWDGAGRLIATAVESFGKLDTLVNNAGILRDRMLVNMSIDEWDAVIRVHLRGTFCPLRHAAAYWRDQSKAGNTVDARVINTASASGLYGNVGQANYGAAKAGIASLTVIASQELKRYGVKVNCIAPTGLTRMTEDRPFTESARKVRAADPTAYVDIAAENVAPLVAWLGSNEAGDVTGRVFNIRGGHFSVAQPWDIGPTEERDGPWHAEEFGNLVPEFLAAARGNYDLSGAKSQTSKAQAG
jgi:NAD(P)-dependent dehydrogenase (short-subunit alcohol dehydrogenase family)